MIKYLGSFTMGDLMPQTLSAIVAVMPRLKGQLAGALRVNGQIGVRIPTIKARIAAVGRIAAALALQPPGVVFNVAANASLIALLQAQIAVLAQLKAAFGVSGIEAFFLGGAANVAGGEFSKAIAEGLPGGRGSDEIYALVLATRFPATFQAMAKVFII